jgi:hypothetical protein
MTHQGLSLGDDELAMSAEVTRRTKARCRTAAALTVRAASQFGVAVMLVVLISGCGASKRQTSNLGAPAAPVKTFLAAVMKISTDRSSLRPATPAVTRCLARGSFAQQSACFDRLARETKPTARPLPYTAEACGVLEPAAQRELRKVNALGNIADAEIRTGGGAYPPSCAELWPILLISGSGAPLTAAVGVMDQQLFDHTPSLTTLSVSVVSQAGDSAIVRVGDSKKTVMVTRVAGVWKIAALDYSDLS